jgi:carbon starvation protein CstA
MDAGKHECVRMLTTVLIALACVFVMNKGTHHHHIHHSIPVVFSVHLSSSYCLKQILEGKKHKVFYHYLSILFS